MRSLLYWLDDAEVVRRPNITLFANVRRTVTEQDPTSAQVMTLFGISLRKTGKTAP